MMPHACMILAAGFGTRMAPLTDTLPKPLIPVAGRPLIEHALAQARGVTASPIVVNAHYRAAQMTEYFADAQDVVLIEEIPMILDSGGGLRNALPHLGPGPVFTLNSDAVWNGPNALATLDAAWQPGEMGALLLMVPPARAVGRSGGGDFALTKDGRLIRDKAGLVYTGAQIIAPEALFDAPDGAFSLNLIWDRLAAKGQLFGAVYEGHWADVGHPAGIALAESMLGYRDAV